MKKIIIAEFKMVSDFSESVGALEEADTTYTDKDIRDMVTSDMLDIVARGSSEAHVTVRELSADDVAAAGYVEDGGTHCPHCASQDITAGAMDADVSIAWQDVKCCHCGAMWTDEFKLTGMRQLKRPAAQGSE